MSTDSRTRSDRAGLAVALLSCGALLTSCAVADHTYRVGGDLSGMVASADGRRLVVEDGWRGQISVIDLASDTVASVTLARQAAAGSNGRLWDRPGSALAVSPDGRRTYVGGAGTGTGSVTVLDNDRPAPELTVPVAEFSAMALSPDGRTLYLVDAGGPVRMLDAGTLRPIGQFSLDSSVYSVQGAAVSPDGRELYLSNPHKRLDVVDLVGRRSVGSVPLKVWGPTMVLSPDGRLAYLTSPDRAGVDVVDLAARRVTAHLDVDPSEGLAISPDGRRLFVDSSSGRGGHSTVEVVATENLEVADTIDTRNRGRWLAVSRDAETLYVIDGGQVRAFDL